jgi:hypothetical protein
VAVQRGSRRLRRLVAPQGIQQFVGSDGLVGAKDQERQQGALFWARRRHIVAVIDDLERPQHPELHGRSEPSGAARRLLHAAWRPQAGRR